MKTTIFIGFILLLGLSQCKKDDGSSILEGPWITTTQGLVTLHTRPQDYGSGNSPNQADIDSTLSHQNTFIKRINQTLNTNFDQPLDIYFYNKYETESKLGVQAGGSTNPGRNEIYYSFGYHQYYPNLKLYDYLGVHEMAHMVAENAIGNGGTSMMIEGLAVAVDGTLGNVGSVRKMLPEWMSEFRTAGKIYLPTQLLEKPSTISETEFYAQSGNFVLWLIDQYGIEKTCQLYLLKKAEFISEFEKITGQTFASMESEYLIETMGN